MNYLTMSSYYSFLSLKKRITEDFGKQAKNLQNDYLGLGLNSYLCRPKSVFADSSGTMPDVQWDKPNLKK